MEQEIREESSIYHVTECPNLGKTIKLNLKAVRDLMGRQIGHFDDLGIADREELQKRFLIYCEIAEPDFFCGRDADLLRNHPEYPPSVDHLPNKKALKKAASAIV